MEESGNKFSFPQPRLHDFHFFQRLDSTLYHRSFLYIGTETINKFLLLLNLFLLVIVGFSLPFQTAALSCR